MQMLKLHLSSRTIDAFYYAAAKNKAPGIVFLHDLTGLEDVNHKTAKILSEEGFHVLLPDLYSEMGRNKYCVRLALIRLTKNHPPAKAY